VTVNSHGYISLLSTNFDKEVVGETCINKNNGLIHIAATEAYSYTAVIDGVSYEFNTDLTISNLEAKAYDACIILAEDPYFEQCFSLVVPEASEITGKSSSKITTDKIIETVEITSGTAPYSVFVNGLEVLQTNESVLFVEVADGDNISVSSKFPCEGVFEKNINLSDDFIVYPNLTDGFTEILLPYVNLKEIEISLFNVYQQLVSKKSYEIEDGKVKISLKDKEAGVYLLQLDLNSPVYLKIIKK
jgi:hypothetical protein